MNPRTHELGLRVRASPLYTTMTCAVNLLLVEERWPNARSRMTTALLK